MIQPKAAPAQPQFATLEEPSLPSGKAYRADIEEDDAEESYYRFMADNPNHGLAPGEDDLPPLEYDEDGNPIAPERSKHMELLPSITHKSTIPLSKRTFTKNTKRSRNSTRTKLTTFGRNSG